MVSQHSNKTPTHTLYRVGTDRVQNGAPCFLDWIVALIEGSVPSFLYTPSNMILTSVLGRKDY